jgi:hypothetical protein
MQNTFEISGDISGDITIYNNTCKRYFSMKLPEKFNKYGFGNLDAKQIIYNKLVLRDFSYYLTNIDLVLNFSVNNGKKDHIFDFYFPESFPHIETDINASPDELKKLILSLRNKVNNLTSQIDFFKSKVEDMGEEIQNMRETNFSLKYDY